jgi:cytochrome c peroxidase
MNNKWPFIMLYALGALLLIALGLYLSVVFSGSANKAYQWQIPDGFPAPQVPADNPMTYAKVELGRALFYETALSGNRAMSCSTCHQPDRSFSQDMAKSSGASGDTLKRNALALVNVAYNHHFTWAHSEINTIEQQMMIPLFADNPIEMGISGNQNEVLARFATPEYEDLFKQAFGDTNINFDRINKSIASFVRSLVSFNSPFDDYAYRDQDDALSDSALRGLELFFSERLECFHCHGGFNFTQSSKHEFQALDLRPFHNTGMYNIDNKGSYPQSDLGLIEITRNASDMGRFRAPTLRNIALTSPYMHDGSIATLAQVINFYAAGGKGEGISNPFKSQFIRGFQLSEQEHNDLLAFLESLSDPSFINNPQHHAPINLPPTR